MALVALLICTLPALAVSAGCAAVNAGQLNYSGASPALRLGAVVDTFYPGDQLFLTHTSSAAKAGVVIDLILTSVSVATVVTGTTGTNHYLTATMGALLPIGVEVSMVDSTAGLYPRTITLKVTCTPGPSPTTMTLSTSANPVVFGQAASINATVSTPNSVVSGSAIFTVNGVDRAATPLVNGVATLSTAQLPLGFHTVSARFAATAGFAASSGTLAFGQTVTKAQSSTTLATSGTPSGFAAPVTFTATIAAAAPGGGVPDGSVIFSVNGVDTPSVALVSGVATHTASALPVGTTPIAVRYLGGTNHLAGTTTTLSGGQVVTKAATTTTLTGPGTIAAGNATTITANVATTAGTPTGTVTFTVDGVVGSAIPLTGTSASINLPSLSVGTHSISAQYDGSATHAVSTGSLAGGQVVNLVATNTTVAGTGDITHGSSATFTAQVTAASGTPSGNVVFKVNGVAGSTVALVGGVASTTISGLAVGAHAIVAEYAGSTTHAASTATLAGAQVVGKLATTTVLLPIAEVPSGAAVALVAEVRAASGTPDGTVQFTIGGLAQTPVGVANGQASLAVPGLAAGTYAVTATYSGGTNFAVSSASASASVAKVATTLVLQSSANPSVKGQAVSVTATVGSGSSVPTGTVVFTIDGADRAPVALSGGVAQIDLGSPSAGEHTVAARFTSSGDFLPSSASLVGDQVVSRAATALSLSASAATAPLGGALTFTAAVSAQAPSTDIPTGPVVFIVDGVPGTPVQLANGVASFTTTDLSSGPHAISASYAQQPDFQGSAGSLAGGVTVDAVPTQTQLTIATTSTFGATLSASVSVMSASGTPSGTVTFRVDGQPVGSAPLANGSATLVVPGLGAGVYQVSAEYNGTAAHAASAAPATAVTIAPSPVSAMVTVSSASVYAGEPVTISAMLSASNGTPTGSADIVIGGAVHSVSLINGAASLTLADLVAGTYSIRVDYPGAANFAATSVSTPDLVVAPAPTDISVTATLPRSVSGEAFAGAINAFGGVGPYAYAVTSGALPTGLDLDPATGAVTGSPSVSGTFHWTTTVTGTAGAPGSVAATLVVLAPTSLSLPGSLGPYLFGEAAGEIIVASGGTAPYAYAVTAGALPPGLQLDPNTGAISGAPSQLGTVNATISASDVGGFTTAQSYTLAVVPPTVAVSGSFADGTVGTPYAATPSVTGGVAPHVFAFEGAYPPGLTIDPATGAISGTPNMAGSYSFAIRATDRNGFGDALAATVQIQPAPRLDLVSALPNMRQNQSYARALTVSGGTAPYAFTLLSGTLPLGLALDPLTGQITGKPTTPGTSTFEIGVTDAAHIAGQQSYTVEVLPQAVLSIASPLPSATGGEAFDQTIGISGGRAPYVFSAISGLPAGLALDPISGRISGSTLVVGTHTVSFTLEDADGATVNLSLPLFVQAPVLSASAPASLDFGTPSTAQISATGGTAPYQFAQRSGALPAALTVLADGTISGTPSEAGSFPIVVTVTDANGFAQDIAVTISVAVESLVITSGGLPDGRVNRPYGANLASSGGTAPLVYIVATGALPQGLSLDPATGAITGTPIAAGQFAFDIGVTDAGAQSASRSYALDIAPQAALVVDTNLPVATAGSAYDQTLTVIGGAAPYAFSVTGTLPGTFALDAAGRIHGTATLVGAYPITVIVTDADGATTSVSLTLDIIAPTLLATNPPALGFGVPASGGVAISGGTMPYQVTLAAGTLPAGLSIGADGSFSGSPSEAGNFPITLSITDANGFSATPAIAISVGAQPMVVSSSLPSGRAGRSYSAHLSVTGGTAPVAFAVASGSLPSGLSLIAATGQILGTPTAAGAYAFDITVTDAANTTIVRSYAVTIAAQTVLTVDTTVPDMTEGTPFDHMIAATSGTPPYQFSTGGSLPPGMVLDATGRLYGTPTSAGSSGVTLDVVDADGASASVAVTLVVAARPVPVITLSTSVPAAQAGQPYAATITASGGAAPYGFAIISGALPSGVDLDSVSGALSGTVATPGTYSFTVEAVDANGISASTTLSLLVASTVGTAVMPTTLTTPVIGAGYTDSVAASGGSAPYDYALTSGTLPPGLALDPVSGGLFGTPSQPGTYAFTVAAIDSAGLINEQSYSLSVAALPAIAPVVPQAGGLGAPYSMQVSVSGGTAPFTFDMEDNPPGLDIDAVTGLVSGTPTQTGTYAFKVNVVDANSLRFTQRFSLTVGGGSTPVVLSLPASIAPGAVSVGYGASVVPSNASGAVTYAIASGTLPAGLSLDASGLIVGTPSASGSFAFSIEAEDAVGNRGIGHYVLVISAVGGPVPTTPIVALSASPKAVRPDQAVTLSASVVRQGGGAATGTVTFLADGVSIAQVRLQGGTAVHTLSSITKSTTFTARFDPDAGSGDSPSIADAITVDLLLAEQIPTQTLVSLDQSTVSPGMAVVATVEVTAADGVTDGVVEVFQGGQSIGTLAISSSPLSITLSDLKAGENIVTARYLGTPEHAASDSNRAVVTVSAAPAAVLSLSLSTAIPDISWDGQAVPVTATVTASSGGADAVFLASETVFVCPRTSLAAGEAMTCGGTYFVTWGDMARGGAIIAAEAHANGLAPAGARLELQANRAGVVEVIEKATETFTTTRARALGNALPLPDILVRRHSAGTRAGTVQASHGDTSQVLSFASSLAEWRNWAAAEAAEGLALGRLKETLPVNVWIDAQFTVHANLDDASRWGNLGTVAIGADYLISDSILAGVMVQADWANEVDPSVSINGSGFLVGPYVSIALSEQLSFDATVLYGQSSNSLVSGGAFTGDFATTRLYAKGALSGYFELDDLTVRPSASFLFASESIEAYNLTRIDGLQVAMLGHQELQYRLAVGATAEYAFTLEDGATLTPMAGFDLGVAGTLSGEDGTTPSLVGRLTTGLTYGNASGLQLGVELSTDFSLAGPSSHSIRATLRSGF